MPISFQKKYAHYYDLFYQDKNYKEEVDFLEKVFKKYLSKKPKTILDLACGTGGHVLLFAKRGYKMSGLDISAGMLERAKEKAKDKKVKIDFYRAPMQNFFIGKKFDAVTCMFSAINYLTNYHDLKKMLGNVKKHLKKNGLFYFDFWNGLAVLDHYDSYRQKIIKDKQVVIKRIAQTKIDPVKQLCWVNYILNVYQGKKKINESKETHELKFYFTEELLNYLEDAGFEVLTVAPFLRLSGTIGKRIWDLNIIAIRK